MRSEEVVIREGLFLKESVKLKNYVGSFYKFDVFLQFRPLSFLGRYASSLKWTGLYREEDLEKDLGMSVLEEGAHYLKVGV